MTYTSNSMTDNLSVNTKEHAAQAQETSELLQRLVELKWNKIGAGQNTLKWQCFLWFQRL